MVLSAYLKKIVEDTIQKHSQELRTISLEVCKWMPYSLIYQTYLDTWSSWTRQSGVHCFQASDRIHGEAWFQSDSWCCWIRDCLYCWILQWKEWTSHRFLQWIWCITKVGYFKKKKERKGQRLKWVLFISSIGHGCGHNLIAVQGVACALAVKTLLEKNLISGSVTLFGTPAEESTCSKITLVKENVVQDRVDFAMMLHPSAVDAVFSKTLALDQVVIEFFGKASHAGASPWEGINALDALMQGFDNVAMLRQQTLPTNRLVWHSIYLHILIIYDRIHGIIKHGGNSVSLCTRASITNTLINIFPRPMLFLTTRLLTSLFVLSRVPN